MIFLVKLTVINYWLFMNCLKNLFYNKQTSPVLIEKERISSDCALDKLQEAIQKININQKIEISISSLQKPHLYTKIIFGHKEKEGFEEPILLDIEIDDPLRKENEKDLSDVRYNVYESTSLKVIGEGWTRTSQNSKEIKKAKEWNPNPIEEKGPFCFFQVIEKIDEEGESTFSSEISDKIHSFLKLKLQELHPIEGGIKVEIPKEESLLSFAFLKNRLSDFLLPEP